MSRQCRRMALSASSDVAGTWKRFSAASSSATCSYITSLRCHMLHVAQEVQQAQNIAGGQKPPTIFCSFKPPNNTATNGTHQCDPLGPHAVEIRSKNAKTPLPPPERASALAGDIGDGSGAIMRPISAAPTPRESNGTPWGV